MKQKLINHYRDFFQKANATADCKEFMLSQGIRYIEENYVYLEDLVKKYFDSQCDFEMIRKGLNNTSSSVVKSTYTLNAIFLICCSLVCKSQYVYEGFDQNVFWDTFGDLAVKIEECYKIKGIYGIFVENWFSPFFQIKAFKLGRFQYRIRNYKYQVPYYLDGKPFILPGDEVISLHIPRGPSLVKAEREISYQKAKSFFGQFFGIDVLKLVCTSWLLYSSNIMILPQSSNIIDFMKDWDIFGNIEDGAFSFCWKIFGMDYTGNPSDLPEKTSLQKSYKQWLLSGGKLGRGIGIKIID